ncbi:MAG TPA: FAD-dependent oxidoreductase [Polyangiaceae bacterium]
MNPIRRGLCFAALPFAACRRAPPAAKLDGPKLDADVIVVGGGLAGLSAACELAQKSVILLEKHERLGGRVSTKRKAGISYEVGALMAYDARNAPSGHEPSRLIQERGRVGVTVGDKTLFGDSASEAVALATQSPRSSASLGATAPSSESAQALADAFFNLLHPGARSEYIAERQGDWSRPVLWDHREAGNSELVAALSRNLTARTHLGMDVSALRVYEDRVELAAGSETFRAELAVIATTASVASRLLGTRAPGWLAKVRYGSGAVVTLGLEKDVLEPFSHVVTPELAMSSVVSTSRDAHRVLTLYFAGKKAESVAKLADDALLARSLDELGRMSVGRIQRHDLAFSDVQRWQELGTIVSDDVYRGFSDDRRQPLPRVLLAGDYTHWDPSKIPYGMDAAIQSGRWAGKTSRRILDRRGRR